MAEWLRFCTFPFGGLCWDPWHGPTPLISHAVEASHIQNRGGLARISLGLIFPKQKKEEDWQWMLAQGGSPHLKINK